MKQPQCYRQWVYIAPLCITLRIKIWVVAYLKFIIIFPSMKKKKIKYILCNFLVRTLQCFHKNFNFFFCPQKVEKTTHKSCSEKLKSTFFSLLPAQPKWLKQKNSCSKMCLIDQLYIELGYLLAMKIIVSHIALWAERKKTAEVFKSVSRSLIIKQLASTIEAFSWCLCFTSLHS